MEQSKKKKLSGCECRKKSLEKKKKIIELWRIFIIGWVVLIHIVTQVRNYL
jgi:preprotein translocase subunit Sec63